MKNEYIQKVKKLLFEDLQSGGDCSPNGMHEIITLSQQYEEKVAQRVINVIIEDSRWIQVYLTRCRHMNRPIDVVLITSIIDAFDYIPG